uniref:Katanin p80 WD40 repeat-containing subunit B1 n=1 Tax=Phallusia mammillata TaxID=59560 RepID=A0A6F9DF05_9ASCI|nr:katanin p80 WD40 repeat-containing subunit B1 [Phallusia mammillata]
MTTNIKKSQKIQEFIGHGSTVTCAVLGQKSGRVMATGGEDGKVNLWHVGSPNCILSLTPLSTSVETVHFNASEELVCAGSRSGALRIWDLSTAKVVRHLTGHKAAVRSIDFHPYGEFIASGSDDHKVRMWDVRRKGCIFTYKGHDDSVSDVDFSPDGRWIASASRDGTCKLWDITAGKLLHELKDHSGPLTCLQYHPREFLLATGGNDRTCKVYDVEQFRLISSTTPEANPIQKILFDESGERIYTASQDFCKVFSWEPRCQHLDTVAVKWGRPADITISADQLMGCSFSQNIVSVYIIDLKSLRKTPQAIFDPMSTKQESPKPITSNISKQASNVTTRPHTSIGVPAKEPLQSLQHLKENQGPSKNAPTYLKADIPQEKEKIFKPTSTIPRSPTKEQSEPPDFLPPNNAKPPFPKSETKTSISKSEPQLNSVSADKSKPMANNPPPQVVQNQPSQTPSTLPVKEVPSKPQRLAKVDPKVSETNGVAVSIKPEQSKQHNKPLGGALSWFDSKQEVPTRDENIPERPGACDPVTPTEHIPQKPTMGMSTVIPADRQDPVDLDVNAFLPPKREASTAPTTAANDNEAISIIRKGIQSMRIVLTNRHKNLEIVRALWTSGDVMTSINAAVKMEDQALVVDILNILVLKPSLWSLDLCMKMLPQIKLLITSKYETYMNVGCNSLKLVLKNFAQVIRSNLKTPPSAVDISREERHRKCKACYQDLASIRSILESKQQTSGKMGSQFRELKILIGTLE